MKTLKEVNVLKSKANTVEKENKKYEQPTISNDRKGNDKQQQHASDASEIRCSF